MATIPPKQFTSKTGKPFTIRSAHPDDAVALLSHAKAVAQESDFLLTEPDEFTMTEDEERQWIQDHLDSPGKICLVAEASGVVIGSLGCESGQRRRVAHCGTFGMAVLKDWRGQGVGTAMLQCFLEWAEANPVIEKVGIGVLASNEPAIRLYRKSGFVEEGRQPKEIKIGPGQYEDVILMYRFVG
jgi:RimJ/RimL family protein N-acetyltransferase